MRIALPDLAATRALAARLAPMLQAGDVILLEGPLGAGKTEFARALLRARLGDPAQDVPSPSYTLLQSYEHPAGTLHHFDFWRLSGPDALHELGWDDALSGIVLAEWPERLGPLRPPHALTLRMSHDGGDRRLANLSGWPQIRLEALTRE